MLRALTAVSLAAAAVVLTTSAQAGWDQTHKLLADDGSFADNFGHAVSISGNTALIGAFADDPLIQFRGSAYLFNATTGKQIAKLKHQSPSAGDYFGFSVSVSGNIALVSCHFDDDLGPNSGTVYIFDASTGSQIGKLNASDGTDFDFFGRSVALSGNTAIVGSYGDDDNGSQSGSAYLFNVSNGTQIAKLKPSDGAADDIFGISAAISGNIALVGSYQDDDNGTDSGSAYLFNVTTGQQIAKLKPNDGAAGDRFGQSVAVSGNIALIGSPYDDDKGSDNGSAYLFDITTGTQIAKLFAPNGEFTSRFGFSVALSGNTALIGNTPGSVGGGAYLFDVTTGTQISRLRPADVSGFDDFGRAVSISNNIALIGSWQDDDKGTDSGSAYLFAQDVLLPSPLSGGSITFNPVLPDFSITLDDIPSITNSGGPGSIINVTGFAFSGPDAALFDLPGYANVTLTAGAFDTIAYDLTFLGASLVGDYSATLTLFTDSGNVTYNIATLVYIPGDANFDNQVDAFDYSTIDDYFGQTGTLRTGDLNQDGFVDAFDYATIDDNFGTGVISRPNATTEVFIPEPASLALLALPGLMLARRRG